MAGSSEILRGFGMWKAFLFGESLNAKILKVPQGLGPRVSREFPRPEASKECWR